MAFPSDTLNVARNHATDSRTAVHVARAYGHWRVSLLPHDTRAGHGSGLLCCNSHRHCERQKFGHQF
jgi:hypothetical protein